MFETDGLICYPMFLAGFSKSISEYCRIVNRNSVALYWYNATLRCDAQVVPLFSRVLHYSIQVEVSHTSVRLDADHSFWARLVLR